MTPLEWWWLYDAKRKQHGDTPLTHDDMAEARAWGAELDAKIRKKR